MPAARTGKRNGHTRQRPATKQAKATSKAKPRRGGAEAASKAAPVAESATKVAKTTKRAAKTTKAVGKAVPGTSPGGLAFKAVKAVAKRALKGVREGAADGLREVVSRAGGSAETAAETTKDRLIHRRLPIQRSVDIAVPVRVAWDHWSALEWLPEGPHTVSDIERDGVNLTGVIDGPRNQDWAGEILDERPEQSFAWQSHQGSDCAGLITFHRLSERLTRVELNLDVIPSTPAQAIGLATRLADRRAQTELRQWKARLELINPDLYEEAPSDPEEDEPEQREAAPDEASAPDEDAESETEE